uniref:ribonuclease P protein subunit p30 isoform X3 n=1 Tax=Scatophagus argus TaxID=75038 RepID=UPI001ED80AF2|nr:ribonuclease P protein subunit p30 isoform X3 [Scatophagus argus]
MWRRAAGSSTMAVFMDLNLGFTTDKSRLQSLIETAAHLGFSTVAINYMFEPTAKKKQDIPSPTPINDLIDQLPVVQGRSRPIRVLNRLTIVMSDSSHFRSSAAEYRRFDLLAVQPTTEKLFHAACMTYDVDIICIPVTEKLPFFFKRAPVNGAVDRGLVFEISYSAAIRDSTMRRYTIANANTLMDTCKGKTEMQKKPFPPPVDQLFFTQKPGRRPLGSSTQCRAAVTRPSNRRLHLLLQSVKLLLPRKPKLT